jgi:hypothetical protein
MGNQDVKVKYKEIVVYQYKEHPKRIWMSVDGWPYLLGQSDGCKFGNPPSTPLASQAQPQPQGTPLPQINPSNPSFGSPRF